MMSPLSGVQKGEAFDVKPYAEAAAEYLLSIAGEIHMPRKLKVAFSNGADDSVHTAAPSAIWDLWQNPDGTFTPPHRRADSAALVIETMQEEKLSYSETCRRFEVNSRDRIKSWERIYLEEGPEGFAVERRGRSSKGRPPKQLPKQVEEDLLAEVQRLRAENDYLKNLQALVLEDERHQHKKRW